MHLGLCSDFIFFIFCEFLTIINIHDIIQNQFTTNYYDLTHFGANILLDNNCN